MSRDPFYSKYARKKNRWYAKITSILYLTSLEWECNYFETGCISYGNLRLTMTDLHTWSKITRVQAGVQYTAAVKRTDLTATASDPSARLGTIKDVSVVSPTTRPHNSFTSLDSWQTTLKHKPTLGPGTEIEIRCVEWISRPSTFWNTQGLSGPVLGLL